MKPRPTQKEKTQRAFRAYLDLMDTADWLKSELRAPLEAFDLTMPGFRLLEMLYKPLNTQTAVHDVLVSGRQWWVPDPPTPNAGPCA